MDGGHLQDSARALRAVGGAAPGPQNESGVDRRCCDLEARERQRSQGQKSVVQRKKKLGGPESLAIPQTAGDQHSSVAGNQDGQGIAARSVQMRAQRDPCIGRGTQDLGRIGLLVAIETAHRQHAPVI